MKIILKMFRLFKKKKISPILRDSEKKTILEKLAQDEVLFYLNLLIFLL